MRDCCNGQETIGIWSRELLRRSLRNTCSAGMRGRCGERARGCVCDLKHKLAVTATLCFRSPPSPPPLLLESVRSSRFALVVDIFRGRFDAAPQRYGSPENRIQMSNSRWNAHIPRVVLRAGKVNPWRLERSRWRGGRLRRDRIAKKSPVG